MTKEEGFSLIELLIVVAIIVVISAIAIPDFLKSRIAANQASAIGSIRSVITAENVYASTYNTGYSSTLAQLDGPAGSVSSVNNAGVIDSVLGGGQKSGYFFYYVACPTNPGPDSGTMTNGSCVTVSNYQIVANVFQGCGTSNGNCYYSDGSGVIRVNPYGLANSTDSPIGN